MRIKKIGHCCLVIDTGRVRILTDPGSFTTAQEDERKIDIILITHEHGDHLHIEFLERVLSHNPNAEVITNSSVARLLVERGISSRVLESGKQEIHGVSLSAFDSKHEEIFEDFKLVQNTAYFIDDILLLPGDSFHVPDIEVCVLALPVAGPWCRIADAVRYAIKVKPQVAFPIHDGMLIPEKRAVQYSVPEKILPKENIEFRILRDGEEHDFS